MAVNPITWQEDQNTQIKPTNVGLWWAPTTTTPDTGISANAAIPKPIVTPNPSTGIGPNNAMGIQGYGIQYQNLSPDQKTWANALFKENMGQGQSSYTAMQNALSTYPSSTATPSTALKPPETAAPAAPVTTTPAIPSGTTQWAPTQPTVPTGTGVPQNIQQITDQLFPKGQYSDEERAAMSEMLGSKNPSEIADLMAQNAKWQYDQSQQLLNAYRTTRDFGIQQAREKQLNDQRVADLTQHYDNAIRDQKNKMEADANNMAMVQGTAGRLQSRNMQNAITQMLDVNKNIYSQLVSNKDRDIARLAEDLKYANTVASNEYNDKVSSQMQDMLKNIEALDKTGSLQTAEGFKQARSFIDATISNNMQHQSDYYNKLSYISQRFDKYREEAGKFKTVDDSVTKTMNDGYLYNSQGAKINDPSTGQPLRVANTSGTLLTKEPITMTDGSKAFVYQNTDGTTRVEKIEGTGATQMTPEAIQHIAQGVSSGAITPELLKSMNLTPEQIQQVLSQTTGAGKAEWKVIGKDENGNDMYWWVNPISQTVTGGGITTATPSAIPKTWTINTWDLSTTTLRWRSLGSWQVTDLINTIDPSGNLGKRMLAIASIEGHAWSSNPDAGWTTAYGMFQFNGWNAEATQAKFNNMLEQWVRVAQAYGKNIDPSTLSQEQKESLAYLGYINTHTVKGYNNWEMMTSASDEEFSKFEPKLQGSVAKPSASLAALNELKNAPSKVEEAWAWELSAAQKQQIDALKWNYFTKEGQQVLKKAGISQDQVNNYVNSKVGKSQLSDDQRTTYFQAVGPFHWNQVVKDYESMIWQTANVISSINNKSGPGDIAAVYQFMKTLDPTSVVRETEFNTAAASSGLAGKVQNMFTKLENGEQLTGEQKTQFKDLMKEYVKNKSFQYDRLYSDMRAVMENMDIPDNIIPKSASEQALKILWIKKEASTQSEPITATGKSGTKYTLKINP